MALPCPRLFKSHAGLFKWNRARYENTRKKLGADFDCEWITTFRPAVTAYDFGMISVPLNVDLMRLRRFLKALETEAQTARGGIDLDGYEIERLKREIADIEGVLNGSPDHGSRAFLFRIPIDYATAIQTAG